MGITSPTSIYQEPSKYKYIEHYKTIRHCNPWRDEKNSDEKLTAKYWGPSVLRPARFPHTEAALICCICCWSCWAIRFCSLSFCVSANFTTMGEEQPCKQQFKQLHTCYPPAIKNYCIKTHSLEAFLTPSPYIYIIKQRVLLKVQNLIWFPFHFVFWYFLCRWGFYSEL